MAWTTADIPAQHGRTAIVTGANTGIGLETAAELAAAGATVVLACRDASKADDARSLILARRPRGPVETLRLDLGDLSSVRAAAAETRERFPRIDVLVANAGVMVPPHTTTADGFELQLGTNHLGHFAYVGFVLGALLGTEGSRVVTVSSIAHRQGRMRWDDLQWELAYDRMAAYGQSKLANLLFTFELQRRLVAAESETSALAAHPGVSATELVRHVPGATLPGVKQVIGFALSVAAQSAAAGALPTLRAATDPYAAGAQYYGPGGTREVRGAPVLVLPARHAVREDDMARLWSVSEELTGVSFPV
jgi:NAD(P)-dependent dehydrogenase (short-subunit alcohol dehydrogenase family)